MGTRQQGGTTESWLEVSGEWAEDVGLVCKANVSDCRGCTKYSGQNVRDGTSGRVILDGRLLLVRVVDF